VACSKTLAAAAIMQAANQEIGVPGFEPQIPLNVSKKFPGVV
jgi:hypothetical protein